MAFGIKRAASRYRLKPGALMRLFARLGPHLRPYRDALGWALLAMVGVAATEIARPWPLKFIFDGLLIVQDQPDGMVARAIALTGGGEALLAVSAGAILLIAVLSGLFGFAQSYLIASVGQKVVASIRFELYSHIQRLSQSFHDQSSTGDLLSRLTGDVRMMRDLLVTSVIYASGRVLVVIGTLAVMALMDWRLTLVSVVILPTLFLTTLRFGGKIKGAARKQRRKEGKIAQVMTESISSITVVQAYAREAYEEERFSKQNASSVKAGVVATRLEAHLDRLIQVILAVGTCAVIWYGVTRVRAGALTPGDLLVFSAYLTTLYKPVRKLASLTGRIAKASVCGERLLAILDLEPDIKDAPDARLAPRFKGEIVFDNVTFGYGSGRPVLNNVTFRIAPGETVALMGESGHGKSTIASLILRFYDPQAGAILIDGKDIRAFTLASLREQIAIVLQETSLFATTIRDNIAYGRLDASPEEIVAAAKAANADDFINLLADGYDTVIGERGATLSGGERQRIAIARAIVRDAPIVILDEAMAGLDRDNEAGVARALQALTRDKTCLYITHDHAATRTADRIFCVSGGSVTERPHTAIRPMPSLERKAS